MIKIFHKFNEKNLGSNPITLIESSRSSTAIFFNFFFVLFCRSKSPKIVLRNEPENIEPKNELFDLSTCRYSSSTDQILTSSTSSGFVAKRLRNMSMDGLNEKQREDETPKRNSIVSEIVAM